MRNICENIRRVRKDSGKTQQEMADLLGVKRGTYATWEISVIPDVKSLIEIGKVLSVDWTTFVKETITGAPITPGKPGPGNVILDQIKRNTEEILKKLEDMEKKK